MNHCPQYSGHVILRCVVRCSSLEWVLWTNSLPFSWIFDEMHCYARFISVEHCYQLIKNTPILSFMLSLCIGMSKYSKRSRVYLSNSIDVSSSNFCLPFLGFIWLFLLIPVNLHLRCWAYLTFTFITIEMWYVLTTWDWIFNINCWWCPIRQNPFKSKLMHQNMPLVPYWHN